MRQLKNKKINAVAEGSVKKEEKKEKEHTFPLLSTFWNTPLPCSTSPACNTWSNIPNHSCSLLCVFKIRPWSCIASSDDKGNNDAWDISIFSSAACISGSASQPFPGLEWSRGSKRCRGVLEFCMGAPTPAGLLEGWIGGRGVLEFGMGAPTPAGLLEGWIGGREFVTRCIFQFLVVEKIVRSI